MASAKSLSSACCRHRKASEAEAQRMRENEGKGSQRSRLAAPGYTLAGESRAKENRFDWVERIRLSQWRWRISDPKARKDS